MKFSLSFLLVLILALAVCFAWFRWSKHETQVHDAIRNGNVTIVSRLLKRRPKLFTANKYHSPSTLLSAAVESGDPQMLALIAPTVTEHVPNQEKIWHALSLAVRNNELEMVRVMLKTGWDPNGNEEFSLLREAKKQGYLEMVELLIDHEVAPTPALTWACEQPDSSFALRLLSLGADTSVKDAFANAIRANHEKVIEQFRAKGVNSALGLCGVSDATSQQAIDDLVANGLFEKLDLKTQQDLMENLFRLRDSEVLDVVWPKLPATSDGGAKLNPIMTMVKMASDVQSPVEKLNVLLQHGAQVHLDEHFETNPLCRLASDKCFSDEAQITFARRLIEDADPTSLFDPLTLCMKSYGNAARSVQWEIAKSIIGTGYAQEMGSEFEHSTPLHSMYGETVDAVSLEIAELLIADGVDVNARDDYGQTPLHVASRSYCIELVEFLLNHGADRTLKTDGGETAMDLIGREGSRNWWRRPKGDFKKMKNLLERTPELQP